MTKQTSALLKTCTHCGLQKPLAAFLQLKNKTQNLLYGNICANCRKIAVGIPTQESDEGTKTTSKLTIDAKTIMKTEQDKHDKLQDKEERELEDRKKIDLFSEQQLNKVNKKAKDERRHRENYLKKEGFLAPKKPDAEPVVGGEVFAAKQREINLIAPVQGIEVSGQVKHNNAIFNTFVKWLGNAPIAQQVKKTLEKHPSQTIEKPEEVVKNKFGPKGK